MAAMMISQLNSALAGRYTVIARAELDAAIAEAIKGNSAAVALGERAAATMPLSRDAIEAPIGLQQLAGVYLLTGRHDKALDLLE